MAVARFPGLVIDYPDAAALAGFYGALLDWKVEASDDWADVRSDDGWCISFQQVDGYAAPDLSGQTRPQQMHLDVIVDDLDAAEPAGLREDVEWINDIGAGPWRRTKGRDAVLAMFGEWLALFDGGFRHELIDVCASDQNVVEILHEVGMARGVPFDNLALYHYTLDDDGQVTHVRTYDRDREAIERFWSAIGPVTPDG